MRVLALAPAQGEDLGLRARRIKVMEQAGDPPQVWDGLKAPVHTFITLLETAKKRRQIEKQLEQIRLKTLLIDVTNRISKVNGAT